MRRSYHRLSPVLRILIACSLVTLLVGAYFIVPWLRTRSSRSIRLGEWFLNRSVHPDWSVRSGERCAQSPFLIPTDGYIGFLWGDSFRPGHQHQGLDIFGGADVDETPVLAAYDGYLTRLPDWKSTVIIRLPQDPLQPSRQIWLYYTHMADRDGNSFISEDFPPGTSEAPVKAGDLLGHQGNYSGNALNPTGVHLHFSIVLDNGAGSFRNELDIRNTLDPSPYLGMSLNAAANPDQVPVCAQAAPQAAGEAGSP